MSYQALYRVYRPRTFDEVVGQDVIAQTLQNAIQHQQTSHAYLFAGPRGTGKTSMAKIFAREINQIDPQTEDSQIPDIIEIDAASNNGVEEIRIIRDNANYAPVSAPYKIYIIDEVHMLSTGAFNALLKTLEEPPAQVKFILATTEPQKIPATILSRVQRFDFKRIPNQVLIDQMNKILADRQVVADPAAIRVIANAADGGMRDALSILDQVLSLSDGQIELAATLQIIGAVASEQLIQYLQMVYRQDVAAALKQLHEFLAAGKGGLRMVEDLISLTRDVLLYRTAPELVVDTLSDELKSLSQTVTSEQLYASIEIYNDVLQQLRFAKRDEVYLEVMTIRLAELSQTESVTVEQTAATSASQSVTPPASEATVETVDAQVTNELPIEPSSEIEEPASEASTPTSVVVDQPETSAAELLAKYQQADVNVVLQAASKDELATFTDAWPEINDYLTIPQQAITSNGHVVAASEEAIVIAFDYEVLAQRALNDIELQAAVIQLTEELLGHPYQLVFVAEDNWQQFRNAYVATLKGEPLKSIQAQIEPQKSVTPDIQPAPENDEKNNESELVTAARELFGNTVEVDS